MISMQWKYAASAATLALCLTTASLPAAAQTTDNSSQTAPDNTGRNKSNTQDADKQSSASSDKSSANADKQSNSKTDRDITAKIRREIMANKDLSTYAHNVKVITNNGAVTLKGPVQSEQEKTKLAEIAGNVVSSDKVTNQITVK